MRYERILLASEAQGRRCERIFLIKGFQSIDGVAIGYDLYKSIGDVYVYTDLEIPKVRVPIIFLGTQGFPPPRDGLHTIY
jgi:hypothetical protein